MNYLQLAICSNHTTQLMEHCLFFNPKDPSTKIINELSSSRQIQTLKAYLDTDNDECHSLRLLSLISILLISKQGTEQLFEESLSIQRCQTSWIFTKIIAPFRKTLLLCCQTPQLFSLIRKRHINTSNFLKQLPYLITLLKSICNISSDIVKMGRYLLQGSQQKTYLFFGHSYITFLNKIYSHLCRNLQSYLYLKSKNPSKNRQINQLLKWVLSESLPQINEKINLLNRSKYFNFKKHGMNVTLFNIQEQSGSVEVLIRSVMNNEDNFNNDVTSLQTMIFPEDGSFNQELFITTLEQQYSPLSKQESSQANILFKKNQSALTASSIQLTE